MPHPEHHWVPKGDAAGEAMALLSAAGFGRDNPLRFEIAGPSGPPATAKLQLLQDQWARLSQGVVKTTIRQYDPAAENTIRANRTFTYYVGNNGGAFPEPDAWFNTLYATGASRNYTGFSDAKFDEMAQKQRTFLDAKQRRSYVRDMVMYLIENAPSTMLVNSYLLNGVTPKAHAYAPELFMNGRQYEWMWMEE